MQNKPVRGRKGNISKTLGRKLVRIISKEPRITAKTRVEKDYANWKHVLWSDEMTATISNTVPVHPCTNASIGTSITNVSCDKFLLVFVCHYVTERQICSCWSLAGCGQLRRAGWSLTSLPLVTCG